MKLVPTMLRRVAPCLFLFAFLFGVMPALAFADKVSDGDIVVTELASDTAGHAYSELPTSLKRDGRAVASLSMGEMHSAALLDDGSLWMWGRNVYGELGDGTWDSRSEPVKVFDSGVESISLGDGHSAAVMDDGSLWVWGWNLHGQIGDGTTDNRNKPVKIIDSNVKSVSLGVTHSAAIMDDGALWMWGSNDFGELGIGLATGPCLTPTKVIESDVKSVSLGGNYSAAVMNDGSLWVWGIDSYGCLGNGESNKDNVLAPMKIIDSGVVSISLGTAHSAAVLQDGSLYAWGYNYYGQVGNDTTEDQHSPVKVIDSGVRQVDFGGNSSAVVMDDGSFWSWGELESLSQTEVDYDSPRKVIDAGVESVSLGWLHAGVIVDHALWMYGAEFWGELGNGSEDYDGFVKGITFGISDDPVPGDPSEGDAHSADEALTQLTACLLSDFNVGNGYEGKTVQDYIDSGAFVDRTIWTGLNQTYGELFSQVLGEYEIVSARAFAYRGAPHIALKHPTSGDVIIAFSEGGPELLESIGVPTYFNDATETLATLEDEYPSSTFYLTGSNAGGMAAAYLSSATHWKATTFNSPAVAATILTALTQPTTLSKTNAFNGVDDMGCVNYYTEGFEDRFGYSRGIAVSARVDANPLGEKDELTSFFEYGDVGYSLRSATLDAPDEMQMFGIQNIGAATEALFEKYEASILSLLDGKSLSDMFGFPSMTTVGDINTVLALGTTGHDSMRVGLFSGEESKDLLGHHVNMTGDASSDVMEGGNTSDVFVMGEGSATLSGRAGSDLYYIGNDALVTIHDTGATDGNNLIDLFRSSYKLVAAHDVSAIPDFAESLGDVLSHTNRDAIIFTSCSFADMDVSYNTAGNYFIIQAGTSRVTVPNRSQDFYIVDASGQTVADGMMLNDLFALKRGVSKSSVNLMVEEATDYSQYVSFYIDGEDAAVRLVDVATGQELRRITVSDATDMTDVCLDYGTFVVDGTGKTIDGLYDSSKIRVEIVGDSDQVITNNIVGTVEGDIAVSENVIVSGYDDGKVEIRADDNVRLVGTKNGVEVNVPTTVVEDNATDDGVPDISNPPSGGSGSGVPTSPSFSPEITETEHGSVTLTPSKPHEGDTVVITPKPDQGFVVGAVTVTNKDGRYVKVAESSDGTWVFMQPDGAVTVEVTFICNGGELCPSRHFLDVGQGTWYHEGVDWVVSAGIMNGYGDGSGTFGPGDNLDRAQLAQVLWNKAGRPEPENPNAAASFVDTNPEAFYAKALAWCVENGYFMGYDKTHFGPSDDMTREQLATVLWRMEGSPEATADLSIFPDAADVSEFAYESMRWAVGADAISGQGSDGKLDPVGTLGRGQCATILFRLYS